MTPYLRFLKQYLELIDHHKLPGYGEQILNIVALHNMSSPVPLRVKELLRFESVGSMATIHKNYIALIEQGFLEQAYDSEDRRVRYIVLSPKAQKLFSKINDLLIKCKKD